LTSFHKIEKKIIEGAEIILFKLGNLKKDEVLCIITDYKTSELGSIFSNISNIRGIKTKFFKIEPLKMHGEEPPVTVSASMKKSDLILGLTSNSMAHTNARFEASKVGSRYLSLPDYSMALLADKSLRTDFYKSGKRAKKISDAFTKGNSISIITDKGTDIHLDITDRKGNFCPGYVNTDILLGSPPDIEGNVPPIENKSKGTIVVDGSIPISGLGKLKTPIVLEVNNGHVTAIEGKSEPKQFLENIFHKYGEKSKILAEFGVGCNELAKISGNMLIDEGSYGTVHFGFGSNYTIGGTNKSPFHLDFVVYAEEIISDDKLIKI